MFVNNTKQGVGCLWTTLRCWVFVCGVTGPVSESNDEDLCEDERLDMDEWPWVGECV